MNRNAADDNRRLNKRLRPVFEKKRLAEISLAAVMNWIDPQRRAKDPKTKKKLSEASVRHNLNLMSRCRQRSTRSSSDTLLGGEI